MKKKYLITGGLGFIGQAIAINLIEKNNLVTIIDNQFRHKNLKSFNYKNCKVYKNDIRDKVSLKKIVKNVDTVIHLAAINGTENFYKRPIEVMDVGVLGIINVFK